MKLSQYGYDFAPEMLARHPADNRDESRLMVIDRAKGTIEHRMFKDILDYFDEKDLFVFNDTKVFPARLYGNKEKTGAEIEIFLLRELNRELRLWDVLVDPARKIRIGNKLYFGDDDLLVAEVIDNYEPELLYFDWWIQHRAFAPYLKTLAAYYYNRAAEHGVEAAICYKYDALAWGAGIVDVERGGFADPTPFVWQTDTAIARNSWCYTDSLDYKTLPELVVALVDVGYFHGLTDIESPGIGCLLFHYKAEQGGFSGSVRAYHTHDSVGWQ